MKKYFKKNLSGYFIIVLLSIGFSTGSFAKSGNGKRSGNTDKSQLVDVTGSILNYSENTYPDGSIIASITIVRPLIDNEPVRSAHVLACLGPDEETCDDAGYELISIEPGYGAVNFQASVRFIWSKLYYDTYYLEAITDMERVVN